MRNIEISTTQNVTIEYELAALKDRIVAFLIDSIIMWGSIIFLLTISLQWVVTDRDTYNLVIVLVALPVFLFYTLLNEIFSNGQTPGKRAMNIKVVKINGVEPQIGDFIGRWAFRILDIYFSLGSIAAILISSTDKGQRLGGMVTDTTLIKNKPSLNIGLKDLKNLHTKNDYEPRFPGVKKFNEEDMLTIKAAIERYQSYPNQKHAELLNELTQKVVNSLNIKEFPEEDEISFLKAILKDYIVMTR